MKLYEDVLKEYNELVTIEIDACNKAGIQSLLNDIEKALTEGKEYIEVSKHETKSKRPEIIQLFN